MKKITLLTVAFISAFSMSMNAQTTLFSDDFNDLDISDWTVYDEDGDTFNWSVVQIEDDAGAPVNTPVLRSASWTTDGVSSIPLTPDNYIVSPSIDLTAEDGTNTITLNWDVSAADAAYADENYTVYVATGNQVTDLTASSVSFNELVTDNGPGGSSNIYTKSLDITSFAGQTVHVGFRHHNVSDEFTIEIDNVSVTSDSSLNTKNFESISFSHFINDGSLYIESDFQLENINIYNIIGKQVSNEVLSGTNASINLSSLQSGVYLAKIEVEGVSKSFKFIKS
ncbi:Por secretion system C-terminal sorting domain-containing protein [Mesonia phycicola]|uniref:Por secretion system C-terminal sorting domain-containing protein n=1 Tax=Mesonia phycicola TaxID=579105 RepID=A0A1M6GR09_9FLAO|nr:choice-of-anchor J domain-containing protein [Mesonia phycicola]SHJ12404.1 Por secretion system C-terminal sorting domain-containing protein [Mesonia phycicola]